jgi:lantibiotic biosynthesis protein
MSSDATFLASAESIAQGIVVDAVWHDGRCSWIGAVDDRVRPWREEYRVLEGSLYDGTAGVGLFLCHLAVLTGEPAVRRTAVGALRHAIARMCEMPSRRRDGFHAGSLGTAWAAARGSALLDEEELRTGAQAVAAVSKPPVAADRCPDVILGSAGSIIALLALAHELDDPALVEAARATGEELVGRASITSKGWAWPVSGRRHRHPPLCGLSHGAAGIGWALLELFAATGDKRFAAGARGAFAYERSWLDRRSGTWPDLRIGGQRRSAARPIASPAVGTWCHGEGGIALTRLRAIEVLGPGDPERDAEIALEATYRALAAALPHAIEDLTLCHGAAGSADVLLCGATRLADDAGLPDELGRLALERYGVGGRWPCGTTGRTTPALFRGLSGIAWWFLRLYDRTTPSPLTMPISG